MSDNDSTMIPLGGLWKGKTRDDKPMLTGSLGFAKIVILPNPNKKDGDNKPHVIMWLAKSEKKNEEGSQKKPEDPNDII